jgi:hypothetical protein
MGTWRFLAGVGGTQRRLGEVAAILRKRGRDEMSGGVVFGGDFPPEGLFDILNPRLTTQGRRATELSNINCPSRGGRIIKHFSKAEGVKDFMMGSSTHFEALDCFLKI